MNKKLLLISDLHEKHEEIDSFLNHIANNKYDKVLISGDFSNLKSSEASSDDFKDQFVNELTRMLTKI